VLGAIVNFSPTRLAALPGKICCVGFGVVEGGAIPFEAVPGTAHPTPLKLHTKLGAAEVTRTQFPNLHRNRQGIVTMLATFEHPAGLNAAANAPTLVLMHFLGGSGREWDEVAALNGGRLRLITVDMPGFGGSADVPGYTVAEMARAVQETIRGLGLKEYILVGHSMSGKVSAVIARREEDCVRAGGTTGLRGMILVAPSPAGPEPMSDEKRSSMVALLGAPHADELKRARSYITKNELRDIPKLVEERASREVLRMNRTAWVAWVERGSREDWAEYVGVLSTPTMVVAGDKDLSLGPEQMHRVVMPHLAHGVLCTVRGCSHLVPMERPEEMARLMQEFVEGLGMSEEQKKTVVPAEYIGFIESERLSAPTRRAVQARMAGPKSSAGLLTGEQERTLRAMLARVVPQRGESSVDLAGFVMARLASGKGDGWRYAVLPEDTQAYREGLDRLAAKSFADATDAAQDRMLADLDAVAGSADARWFEEVRSDAISAYIAHPATLARIGYSGLGVGGAATRFKGYVSLEPNGREDWEPLAMLSRKPVSHADLSGEVCSDTEAAG
jgi:pimeloyl-ACP methyl ester carboxylesterase